MNYDNQPNTQAGNFLNNREPIKSKIKNGEKRDLWSVLLDDASQGKRLPEKSLIVLGCSPEQQTEFVELLCTDNKKSVDHLSSRKLHFSNRFSLGYTYEEVLDADQEDVLARLSIHLLADCSSSFIGLLKPIITTQSIPNTLIVILLDWNTPWQWLRQLRDWLRRLRTLLLSLDDESKDALEENIKKWRGKGRNVGIDPSILDQAEPDNLFGPGEWDEPLGLPISVVCQNTDRMTMLQQQFNWRDDDFDFVLQCLRTVILKHGGSLIYTMPDTSGALQILIHSTLGIQSLLKKKELKPVHYERDHIVIPSNWDTWGKIRVLREAFFDIEGLSKAWSSEIRLPIGSNENETMTGNETKINTNDKSGAEKSAVEMYEKMLKGPHGKLSEVDSPSNMDSNKLEVESISHQKFLENQLEILDKLNAEDEKSKAKNEQQKNVATTSGQHKNVSGVVEDQIGPVQFNMGGIQVDAEDMVKKLKDREASRATGSPSSPVPPDGEIEHKNLASFFAGLTKRGGSNSANSTPTKP